MKDIQKNIHDALLAKYLDGSATHQEIADVDAWIKMSDENKQVFEQFQNIWAKSYGLNINTELNFDNRVAFKNVLTRIKVETNTNVSTIKRRSKMVKFANYFARVAAVLVIGVCLYFIYQNFKSSNDKELLTDSNKTPEYISSDSSLIVLPDNSTINLNKGGVIKYAKNFTENRTVFLSGEAFFDVKKLKGKSFTVQTDDIEIKVLGTSFYVKSSINENIIELGVVTGTVQISQKATKQVFIVKASETIQYKKNAKQFNSLSKLNTNNLFWKTDVLEFNEQPLEEVFIELTNAYKTQINYQQSGIQNCTFTGRFQNATLDEIMEQIRFSFKITVTKTKNGEFVVKGKGCNQ